MPMIRRSARVASTPLQGVPAVTATAAPASASPPPLAAPPEGAVPATRPITAIANQANACLGLVGITGSGKTSLGVTAVEEAYEVYHKITRWYASDLGGFGNKLLALIRLGICQVWYIRNHVNPFTTMDLASLGYWPLHMLDRETGLAAPDVVLVPPRQVKFTIICPNDHPVATYADPAQVGAAQVACPTCGQITNVSNAKRVDRVVVRTAGFKDVGHYVYDSMSQMSEYGAIELKGKSARGELPAGREGGSALGSADAVREEGGAVFGTGSKAQVGFMQDRVPVWLGNIRALPDQVLPPIVTFGVERSKGDDESGGIPIFGPKIAGNARTSQVPGWLGNCLYVAKEPHTPPEIDENGNIVLHHRLWLVNHIDPRDTSSTPIVAKHRGEPLGMPDYLEDSGKPEEAWQRCSLRVFYKLVREQAVLIEERARLRFPDAPGIEGVEEEDEVLEVAPMTAGGAPTSVPTSTRTVRRSRRPGAAAPPGVDVPAVPDASTAGAATPAPVGEQATAAVVSGTSVPGAAEPSPSPIQQQLEASLEARKAEAAINPAIVEAAAVVAATEPAKVEAVPLSQPTRVGEPVPAVTVVHAPVSSDAPPPAGGGLSRRIRRVPRPPAE